RRGGVEGEQPSVRRAGAPDLPLRPRRVGHLQVQHDVRALDERRRLRRGPRQALLSAGLARAAVGGLAARGDRAPLRAAPDRTGLTVGGLRAARLALTAGAELARAPAVGVDDAGGQAALLRERAHARRAALARHGAVLQRAAAARAHLARAAVGVGHARLLRRRVGGDAQPADLGARRADAIVAQAQLDGAEILPRRDAVADAPPGELLLRRKAARGDDQQGHVSHSDTDRVTDPRRMLPPDENAAPGNTVW